MTENPDNPVLVPHPLNLPPRSMPNPGIWDCCGALVRDGHRATFWPHPLLWLRARRG